jgi:hypothetical protein
MNGALITNATQRGIIPPTARTLARYGLSQEDWLGMLERQGWCCPICRKHRGVQFTTDHEHVRGWAKMPPEQRRLYVRGILCRHCNWKIVHSRLTAVQAQRITDYLVAYEERRDIARNWVAA